MWRNSLSTCRRITDLLKRDVPADDYQQFLAILTSYYQNKGSIEDVCTQAELLFAEHNDLLTKFQEFLPNTSPKRGSVESGGVKRRGIEGGELKGEN